MNNKKPSALDVILEDLEREERGLRNPPPLDGDCDIDLLQPLKDKCHCRAIINVLKKMRIPKKRRCEVAGRLMKLSCVLKLVRCEGYEDDVALFISELMKEGG